MNAHRQWWIKRMIHAQPGFTRASDPVYPKFDDARNISPVTLMPIMTLPIIVGCDGGLTPAAAYFQELANGQMRILAEIQLARGGMRELATAMLALEAGRFRGCDFHNVCDPAMAAGEDDENIAMEDSQVSEGSDRQRLSKYLERTVRRARTQDVTARIEAIACKFDLTIDGGAPGLLVDPSCKALRRASTRHFISGRSPARTIAGRSPRRSTVMCTKRCSTAGSNAGRPKPNSARARSSAIFASASRATARQALRPAAPRTAVTNR